MLENYAYVCVVKPSVLVTVKQNFDYSGLIYYILLNVVATV